MRCISGSKGDICNQRAPDRLASGCTCTWRNGFTTLTLTADSEADCHANLEQTWSHAAGLQDESDTLPLIRPACQLLFNLGKVLPSTQPHLLKLVSPSIISEPPKSPQKLKSRPIIQAAHRIDHDPIPTLTACFWSSQPWPALPSKPSCSSLTQSGEVISLRRSTQPTRLLLWACGRE